MAVVPTTIPGVYYILIRGHSEPADDTPVTVLAQLLPLSINNVQTDQGGDSQYVTTTITGAQFQPNAIVKLVMPGFAEYQPLTTDFVNSTEIIAEFDLTGAPHGLYDVQVINPDGQMAIAAYRFEVEQTVSPDVTVGLGGPRFILAGDTGTYSVHLDNLGNINAPYVEFNIGVPELSNAVPRQIRASRSSSIRQRQPLRPAVRRVHTNLSGAPPDSSLTPRCRTPRSSRRPTRPRATATSRCRATCSTRRRAASTGFTLRCHDLSRPGGLERSVTSTPSKPSFTPRSRSMPRRASSTTAAGPRPDLARSLRGCTSSSADSVDSCRFHSYHSSSTSTRRRRPSPAPSSFPGDTAGRPAADRDPRRQHGPDRRSKTSPPTRRTGKTCTWPGSSRPAMLFPDGTTPPISQNPLIMSVMATLPLACSPAPRAAASSPAATSRSSSASFSTWYGNDPDATAPVADYNDTRQPRSQPCRP